MKKNAFTLIELLATVVILVVVFMIITPKLTRIVKDQETKQKELLKEKLISSAKEYANDYDKYFFDGIKKVGDSNTVTIEELIEVGLIDEDETKDFNEFYGVKVELKDNDRIEYNGEIYLGVVGAVRTGKSTFIKRFIETLVLPNIEDEYEKKRCLDELPQSAQGKTIMTTEPKFVPSNAAKLKIEDFEASIRLVDCVGYVIEGSKGYEDENGPRMVRTPWVFVNM